jgi:cytochrome c556
MSKALTKAKNKEVREASDGYVDAVKQLGEQLKKRDTMGARKAIMLLGESCSDCHYKGGPGGRLED